MTHTRTRTRTCTCTHTHTSTHTHTHIHTHTHFLSCPVQILQQLILMEKTEHQGDLHNFNMGHNISVMIRRPYIYEDAFEKLSLENGKVVSSDVAWTGFVA